MYHFFLKDNDTKYVSFFKNGIKIKPRSVVKSGSYHQAAVGL